MAYRRNVVFVTTTTLTVLIIILWLATFSWGTPETADSKTLANDLKPFEEIKSSVATFYTTITGATKSLFGGLATDTAQK